MFQRTIAQKQFEAFLSVCDFFFFLNHSQTPEIWHGSRTLSAPKWLQFKQNYYNGWITKIIFITLKQSKKEKIKYD